jgi:hypothetical protein
MTNMTKNGHQNGAAGSAGSRQAKPISKDIRTMKTTSWSAYLLLMLLITAAAGCGDLFDVENPTNILDTDLSDPELASALATAPEAAMSGGSQDGGGYGTAVLYGAQISDEGWFYSTRSDRIRLSEGYMDGWNENYDATYNDLSLARWVAADMLERLAPLVDMSSDVRVAEVHYWLGLSLLMLWDYFEEVTLDGAAPITPAAALTLALTSFDNAASVAAAAGNSNLQAAALGSKARTYRSLFWDDGDGMNNAHFVAAGVAAEAALAANPTYLHNIRHSPPSSINELADNYTSGQVYQSMHPRYAFTTDPVSGTIDPRIVHTPLITVGRGNVDYYEPLKWTNISEPIAVSRWQEAALVLAEAHWTAGNMAGAVDNINLVRAAAGLVDFASSDGAAILTQLKYERATEFWLEGRRWQDMRYYNITNTNWAVANQEKGIDRRWPVSQQEIDSNTFYTGFGG